VVEEFDTYKGNSGDEQGSGKPEGFHEELLEGESLDVDDDPDGIHLWK
jgi:hypothetical protein